MNLTGFPWRGKNRVEAITDRVVPRPAPSAETARHKGLLSQRGVVPSFFIVVSSFVLGIVVAGLVLSAYSNMQRLLRTYQDRLEQSAQSLAKLSSETNEMLGQMTLALSESQRKIEELEQMRTALAEKQALVEARAAEASSPAPVSATVTEEPKPPVKIVEEDKAAAEKLALAEKQAQDARLRQEKIKEQRVRLEQTNREIALLMKNGIPEGFDTRIKLIDLYKAKTRLVPNEAPSFLMVGKLSARVGNYKQAEEYLERCLDKGGQIREVVTELTSVYDAWQKPEQADHYRQILAGL